MVASSGDIRSLLREGNDPIFLLGAGASITSGIPLAGEVAERAARWAWCWANGRSPYDQQVVRSDWWPWLCEQEWFDKNKNMADQYPIIIGQLLGVRERRKEFFHAIVSPPNIFPSKGYEALASILHEGWANTVLTTNFDSRLEEAKVRLGRPHHIVSMRTPSDMIGLSTAPRVSQLVYLHGSIEHYSDKNLVDEIKQLEDGLSDKLLPLLRDHPVVVVGYRGTEPSIMEGLFLKNADNAHLFNRGLYWCARGNPELSAQSSMVQQLAAKIGQNFQLVQIESFDKLMEEELWLPLKTANARSLRKNQALSPAEASFDMSAVKNADEKDLDWTLVRTRMQQYAGELGLSLPSVVDQKWASVEATRRNLIVEDSGKSIPTIAGWLLFAQNPQSLFDKAKVIFKAIGPVEWLSKAFGEDVSKGKNGEGIAEFEQTITGNLWVQLDAILALLALLNPSFRLKEDISRNVHAYDPLVLKEVIVNALVHRDYSSSQPVVITVYAEHIIVSNPGGLIPEVSAQTNGLSIEQAIREGSRGIKGYRNPVISDLFYGGGQMDRKGSGLSDILRLSKENAAKANFGPTPDNDIFKVTVYARPEAADKITNTATSTSHTVRFAANILEIQHLPKNLWHAAFKLDSPYQLKGHPDVTKMPPFYVHDGRIFSFYNLEEILQNSPEVGSIYDADFEQISVDEFVALPNGERGLVQLLNKAVANHLGELGLIVDRSRGRAYFPKFNEGEYKITYKGRVRSATRTVTKARFKRNTEEVIYWEHKAISYQPMRFGDTWGIILNPGYSFTKDGEKHALGRERVGVLSTKRASRDYNQHVHHDITFWSAIFSDGEAPNFSLKSPPFGTSSVPDIIFASNPPVIATSSSIISEAMDGENDTVIQELEDELEHLVQEEIRLQEEETS